MKLPAAFVMSSIICTILLTACMPSTMVRLNTIREDLLPTVQKEITAAKLEPGAPSFIRIFKEESELELWMHNIETGKYQLYKTYPICNYSGRLGPKLHEGDHQSPEGFYEVSQEWLWPGSKYHLAMNIGFPNEYDKAHKRTGTNLMIHGGCKSEGCYAMTDAGIEEIYLLVEQSLLNGQPSVPIHIFPFRMSAENIEIHKEVGWIPFWLTLKQGYDAFQRHHIPPTVHVQNGQYFFETEVVIRRGEN